MELNVRRKDPITHDKQSILASYDKQSYLASYDKQSYLASYDKQSYLAWQTLIAHADH